MMAETRNYFTTRRAFSDRGAVCYQIADNNFRKKIAVPRRTGVISFRGEIRCELVGDRHGRRRSIANSQKEPELAASFQLHRKLVPWLPLARYDFRSNG